MEVKKKFTVGASPHEKSPDTVTTIMRDVILALLPALCASVFFFGWRSLIVTFVSVGSCVLFEYLSRLVLKRPNTIGDLSAVVTGILLAFNLPPTIPYWMVVIGSAVAIIVVKQFFGGIGQNFVNPALVGRIVIMLSFPSYMSQYVAPNTKFTLGTFSVTETTATPLSALSDWFGAGARSGIADAHPLPSLLDMFIGKNAGCLGEVCAVALILGGIYLVIYKVISPTIPLVYIGTVAAIMLIASKGDFTFVAYQILSGGLLLGAIFMATDYTTSPINFKGKIIFALGCGILTSLIRLFASMNEGVSFSIIIMNILVPHIERLTTPKPFGTPRKPLFKKKDKEEVSVA